MSTYLVTGGGRGIGLEMARQLIKHDQNQVSKVFVTIRSKPSKALDDLVATSAGRLIPVECEVTDPASIEKAVVAVESHLGDGGLDVLVNNVGMMAYYPDGINTMSDSGLQNEFNVNVVSPHRMTAAFIPLLKKGSRKTVVNISTGLGSFAEAPKWAWAPAPAYKITKTALNMLTVQYAQEFAKEGFTFVALSPGWLKTDMGSANADLDVDVGVQAALNVITGLTPKNNGQFLNIHVAGWENKAGPTQYDGKQIAW